VTAERSRTVVLSRSDTSGEATGERTYREEEVAAILQRAAQLERLPDSGEGRTHDQTSLYAGGNAARTAAPVCLPAAALDGRLDGVLRGERVPGDSKRSKPLLPRIDESWVSGSKRGISLSHQ